MNVSKLTFLTLLPFLLASCGTGTFEPTAETWVGTWEDGTGYELTITEIGKRLVLKRTGEPSQMTIKNFSDDFRTLVYEEKSEYAHFLHTLTLLSEKQVSDKWFDLETESVWQIQTMNKKK